MGGKGRDLPREFVKWGIIGIVLVGLVSGAMGGLVAVLVGGTLAPSQPEVSPKSDTPGMDYIDAFACPDGLVREVLIGGVEDDFSAEGEEKATPRAALMELPMMQHMAQRNVPNGAALRDYDEVGTDKHLIDHFEIDPGVVSGKMLFSARPLEGSRTDYANLGDRFVEDLVEEFHRDQVYGLSGIAFGERGFEGLITIDFADLRTSPSISTQSLIDYLNQSDRPLEVDFTVADDTVVDFAALLICREPRVAMGTGFTAASTSPPGSDMTYFACGWDLTSPLCEPSSGHLRCDAEQRIACYRDMNRAPPEAASPEIHKLESFVPGEINLSSLVRPERFESVADANAFCAAEFGEGWRTLSFHEGGGTAVLTHSKLEPYATGLVHVADQPYGNCWDRPESVIDR